MKNLVVTGFMGTGKSAVASAVARALGAPFIDMDEVLAERAGMPVADIFERQGEQVFRAMEGELAGDLGRREGLVIATGGGTMLRADSRDALSQNSLIVCLSATVDDILRRLEGDSSRPLLANGDKRERVAALLAERRGIYESLPILVDTTGQSVAAVAEAVLHKYVDG